MKKVYVFFAEGFEEIEALTVVDLLRRAGIETEMVSITGENNVVGAHNIKVEMDKVFHELDFSQAEMLVLPGGMPGTKNLEAYKPLTDILVQFNQENRYLSAICAAPSILGHLGILNGHIACSYPTVENQLMGATVTQNPVEVSGNIITSRGMGCAIDFSLAIIQRLRDKETATKIATGILYE